MSIVKEIRRVHRTESKWDLRIKGYSNYYANGVLVHNSSGDDVTANVLASKLVPALLPGYQGELEVRGEVFMDWMTFRALNLELEHAGQPLLVHPRNAAAGALRLHDPQACAARRLRFLPHGVIGGGFNDYHEAMTALAHAGFYILPECIMCAGDYDRLTTAEALKHMIGEVYYPIDGLVMKLAEFYLHRQLGHTSRAPRWAVALKFVQERVTTTLESITVQVGRSGALTPVAELRPVYVDGATISRATLHNEDQINRLGVRPGDLVEVRRAAGVIPEIVRSVTHDQRREELEKFAAAHYPVDDDLARAMTVRYMLTEERPPFDLFSHVDGQCPSCYSTQLQKQVVAGEEGARWLCMNPSCPEKLASRIQHFCSRKCLDITGIGEEAATAAAEHMQEIHETGGPAPDPMNLLDWKFEEFEGLAWATESGGTMTFGPLRAAKAVEALERARSLPLHRWIFALGIPSVGENTSKEIARLCQYVGEIQMACQSGGKFDLIALMIDKSDPRLARFKISSHLGPVSCQRLIEFSRTPEGDEKWTRIFRMGIVSDCYNPEPEEMAGSSAFAGRTVCLTGTLSVGRTEFEQLLTAAGAKMTGSVSKKTDYLVAGDACGSKLDKARQLGVKVLNEEEARALL